MVGAKTLRLLTYESDLVVHARVVDPAVPLVLDDPPLRETLVDVELLEPPLKGRVEGSRIRFAQHGHGVPKYRKGEEIAVFLRRIQRSRELGASPLAGHVAWVSVQEEGAKFALERPEDADLLTALRDYAALERLPASESGVALRRATLRHLASPHPDVAASALRDVVLSAGATPILDADDLPELEPLLRNPAVGIGVRLGLLVELSRRGLIDGEAHWTRLLRNSRGAERLSVVRAAGRHPNADTTRELAKLLESADAQLVAAAAVALGSPGNHAAVEPLARTLAADSPRVRTAAIRALGGVGTASARAKLAEAAESHADRATRRAAQAELRLLGGKR